MNEWAKRLGEAMDLRERIEGELSEAESELRSYGVHPGTP
jgi:hypothetical protein